MALSQSSTQGLLCVIKLYQVPACSRMALQLRLQVPCQSNLKVFLLQPACSCKLTLCALFFKQFLGKVTITSIAFQPTGFCKLTLFGLLFQAGGCCLCNPWYRRRGLCATGRLRYPPRSHRDECAALLAEYVVSVEASCWAGVEWTVRDVSCLRCSIARDMRGQVTQR